MGFLAPAPDVPEVLTVATLVGPAQLGGQRFPRARTFVLEDRTVVIVHQGPTGKGAIERLVLPVEASDFNSKTKQLSVIIGGEDPGMAGTALTVTNHCGCGWGAVTNAGPTDGPYRLTKVRVPEWHTVTR